MKVFQTENIEVLKERSKENYEIVYDPEATDDKVVIYFSSNGIYYPNESETFQKTIIENDRYEWTKNKVTNAKKHIFVRDLFKQWYIEGINPNVNSVEKLYDFLRKESAGYKVVTVGSSAGGYAAMLYGKLLKADYVLSFSAQFTLYPLIEKSNSSIDPLLYKYLGDEKVNKYFDISSLINESKVPIYYFSPALSEIDKPQLDLALKLNNVNTFYFNSKEHGIPVNFLCLMKIIQMNNSELKILYKKYKEKMINKTLFSLQLSGLIPNIKFGYGRLIKKLNHNVR